MDPFFNGLSHAARLQMVLHLAKYNICSVENIAEPLPLIKSTG
jgi:hypothetical protein